MTDTSTRAVERPCPNCGVTLDGHSGVRSYGTYSTHDTAYCLRYLRDQRDAANARADQARDTALVEAADIILADFYDDPDSAVDAILALRDKPAPAVAAPITTVQDAARVLLSDADAVLDLSIEIMRNRKPNNGNVMGYQPAVVAALRAIAGGGDE